MTITTGSFDSFGIPQGSPNRLDDIADVDTAEVKEGNTLQHRGGRWVPVDGNEVAISNTLPEDRGVELWINPEEGELSAGVVAEYTWTYDSPETMADPGSSKVRTNTAAGTTPSQIAISAFTKSGLDVGNVIRQFLPGDVMYFQEFSNSVNWGKYEITGAPVDNTTWFQFPVSPLGSAGTPIGKNTEVLVRFTYGANSANVDPRYVAVKGDKMEGELDVQGTKTNTTGILLPGSEAMVKWPTLDVGLYADNKNLHVANQTATAYQNISAAAPTLPDQLTPKSYVDAVSYPGHYGWAGRTMQTDKALTADVHNGLIFEGAYTLPPGMTAMTYSTGAIAGVTGTCSLFTILKTAYYQVNLMVDVLHATLNNEALFTVTYWTNGGATSANYGAKQLVGSWGHRLPQLVHGWTRDVGDVIGVSIRPVGASETGWIASYAGITIVSL